MANQSPKNRGVELKTLNRACLLGNVGRVNIKTTGSGMAIADLSLATSERKKDAAGNFSDETEWHNLIAFGRTAEFIRDYVQKGAKLYVEGSLRTQSWDDKTSGQKRYKTEIVVNELSLLSGRDEHNKVSSSHVVEQVHDAPDQITEEWVPF
jgi:single-strand DNA-binding protein